MRRGLKLERTVSNFPPSRRPKKVSPMRRGLKPAMPSTAATTYLPKKVSPMRRGLKPFRPSPAVQRVDPKKVSPMRRGLKRDQ